MYINSATKLDQEIFNGINFEDAVGLGEKITAVQEWNREMLDKGQKRTDELFNINYTKSLKEEIKGLKEEIKGLKEELENEKQEKTMLKQQCNAKDEEINKIYNSKRWKYIDKLDKFMGRKK